MKSVKIGIWDINIEAKHTRQEWVTMFSHRLSQPDFKKLMSLVKPTDQKKAKK